MKKALVIAGLLVSLEASAFAVEAAADNAPRLANHYACSFDGRSSRLSFNRVVANTTNHRGMPDMYMHFETGLSLAPPPAFLANVTVSEAAFGLEISGYNRSIADAFEAWTLLVPKVTIYTPTAITVPGMMVRSFSSGMPFGPVVTDNRPAQQNTFVPVNCIAAHIQP